MVRFAGRHLVNNFKNVLFSGKLTQHNTNHQPIVPFKGQWYFIYHNGGIQTDGGSYSRSVCIDKLVYNPDGTIQKVVMTSEGILKR